MADIRCPNCGKDNPDFLDACQFCQTPLEHEANFQIGDNPTKKSTGELEAILPDWLKDVRQQSRDAAAEDAIETATTSPVQKDATPDLLAGLAGQAESEDDEIPDWLASLNPVGDKKASKPSESESSGSTDFFAQFAQEEAKFAATPKEEPVQPEAPSQTASEPQASEPRDELGDWLSQTSQQSSEPFSFDSNSSLSDGWNPPEQKIEETKEPEDLSWLRDLESAASQSNDSAPQNDMGWMSNLNAQPSDSQGDDLSWLNNLGGVPAADNASPFGTAAPQDEDLSWLNNLGGVSAPSAEEKSPSEPVASQSDDLSWLNNLGGSSTFDEPGSSKPAASQDDDLGWLNNLGGTSTPAPEATIPSKPASSQNDDLSWLNELSDDSAPAFDASDSPKPASQNEDLDWLKNLGDTSTVEETSSSTSTPASSQDDDLGWLNNLGGSSTFAEEEPATVKPEASQDDMGWLKDLGGNTTETSALDEAPTVAPQSSQDDLGWLKNLDSGTPSASEQPAQSESSENDLDWLSNLGGSSAPAFSEPVAEQPASSQDDLDWLKNLGGESAPAFDTSTSEQPTSPAPQGDLDWLSSLGNTPAPETAPSSQPFADQGDMDWLKGLGEESTPDKAAEADASVLQNQLDWLSDLGGAPAEQPSEQQTNVTSDAASVSPFSSLDTGPLVGITNDMSPDWLKSATEEKPSMPPPGSASMDWFKAQDDKPLPSKPEPASAQRSVPFSDNSSSTISNQDVDSLFNVEMPDWLSQKTPDADELSSKTVTSATPTGDLLAPVDLPSWVQAMKPVEAVIDNSSASAADQVVEKEGPLAGFSGLIPSAPIGSSRRPKAISLKLLATDEQQANAALLEQIVAGETMPHPLKSAAVVAPQRVLRWILTGLFLLVLGAVVGLNLKIIPVFSPNEVRGLSDLVATIPDNSSVLVVVDYEPSLVGELEAASGPLLDQLALTRHSQFRFLSTSPTGAALVERLMSDTNINKSAPNGLGYQAGSQYLNMGFLPGGSAGILGFLENPQMAMPSADVASFADFSAVIVLTDHAESSRTWIEQIQQEKQKNQALANQKLLIVSSAQAGPLLQPYVSSGQVNAMISGLSDAAQYENINNTRPGIARTYWDAFSIGLMMAIVCIVIGSVWSLISGLRTRRSGTE